MKVPIKIVPHKVINMVDIKSAISGVYGGGFAHILCVGRGAVIGGDRCQYHTI